MSNRARNRHFQAAVLRKLYPPQPFYDDDLHLPHNDNQVEHKQIIKVPEIVRDVPSEDETNSRVSDSQSDSGESIGQHLTRAQRKRIRKRKRKEAVSSSKKLIGPLLPDNHVRENSPSETPKGLVTECSDTHTGNTMSDAVRSADLSEGLDSGSLTFHVKLKQRRLAKKLNNKSARPAQRENSSKVFMAESCETGYVLKHL